ncbi:S1C family serine protease [Bacillus tuaregi]|uniref:S1C family serine protease n=1 Tax=Bacillus tuaregi TaxID=1816695 RepID=UPI0008F844E5|nr:trypsin-like peptidase domain-containing protein [Bacillus tuaregi]
MNDEKNNSQLEKEKKSNKPNRLRFKGLMNTLAGGIIGSVLTITILPQTNFFEVAFSSSPLTAEQASSQSSQTNAVTVQKTAAGSGDAASASVIADMVEESSKSIVGIVNMQTQTENFRFSNGENNRSEAVESGSGTGVIYKINDKNAFIVTNNHVIEGAQEIAVTVYGGEKTTAELVGADPLTDIAVLKIDAKYVTAALEFGDSSTLRAGDTVLAIGNPLGLDLSNTVTQGIVSAVDRTVSVSTSAGNWDLNVIQTDAAINPGNSGGALVNTTGQVIGMNSLKIAEDGVEGLGFAIPSNDLVPIINEIMEKGQVERPYIGVGLANLEEVPQMYTQNLPNEIEGGVMVTNIDPGSAAAKAGLQVQDVIVSINDRKVENSADLRKYLYSELEIGETASLSIYRGSEKKSIEVFLTSNNSN